MGRIGNDVGHGAPVLQNGTEIQQVPVVGIRCRPDGRRQHKDRKAGDKRGDGKNDEGGLPP